MAREALAKLGFGWPPVISIPSSFGEQNPPRLAPRASCGENPSDVRTLDKRALRRFEALCEAWAKIAEAERARRRSLPFQADQSSAQN
jgi:hypothetical protein